MKIESLNNEFNIAGLCKVSFQLADRVKKVSLPDTDHQVTVELKPGFDWDEIQFTRTAEDVQINQVDDESGAYYKVNAKLVNPRLTASKAGHFTLLEQRKLVFLFEDNNGFVLLVGSPESPAKLKYTMSNPGRGRNERIVTIDAMHEQEPYFVEAMVVSPGGAFSDGFSNGFSI